MKIKKIISQNRRDFQAIYECEHCECTSKRGGYDDDHFHRNVIPAMKCEKCGKSSPDQYRPLAPKYSQNTIV
jgi:hypothetical protein